ncbi:hypothetical protein K2P56_00605 [Patescibacteria group bacterium]|nr:hypothetical protein [Patescibacteria group bacterium]
MKLKTLSILLGAILLAIFSGALVYYVTDIGCSPVSAVETTEGSQGFRTWSGPSLVSFEHQDRKICVEKGWKPLGETESGNGWVRYKENVTGVLIRSEDFEEKKLAFVFSAYDVALVYPKNTPPSEQELYEASIRNAFERIGKLFNDSKENKKRMHSVLVTVGIARNDGKTVPVYPDPRDTLSIYVQPPTSIRGEELLIHAIAHLYNRQRGDMRIYQENQNPIPAEDFQELEASWSEIKYRTSPAGREFRVRYLYNVHTAVQTKDFSLVSSYPFNSNKQEFEAIRPSVILKRDASFLEAQYTHYILAPLAMLAIEGLLVDNGTSLETLLTEIHRTNENFFDVLAKSLTKEEIESVRSWMFDGHTIPYELVEIGMSSYNPQ